MSMSYREFRDMARGLGLDEIWRQPIEGHLLVVIGKRQDQLIPYSLEGHEIILPNGDETVLEDEEVVIHMHWIEKRTGKKAGS